MVIETAIRTALGIEPGFVTVRHLKGDSVEIRFYPPEHKLSLRGTLAAKVRRSVPARRWREEKETAWKEAVASAAPAPALDSHADRIYSFDRKFPARGLRIVDRR